MKRVLLTWVLVLGGCSKGGPEGTYLSNVIPLEVKKQQGESYAIALAGDLQFLGALKERTIAAKHNGKDLTLEFDEAWNKVTLRDGVLAREFTRVPPEELSARIEQARALQADEKKRLKTDGAKNAKRLKEAEALLAKGKHAEAQAAFEALAAEAPDYEAKQVQDRLAELDAGTRSAADP
jgi:hypothetical protein